MERDYSAAKLAELKSYVNSDMSLWEDLIDKVFDLGIIAKKVAGFLDLEKCDATLERYHRDVVDMHNYTCQDLDKIFDTVWNCDAVYCNRLRTTVLEQLKYLNSNMMSLADMIDPATPVQFTASGIQMLSDRIQRVNETRSEQINAAFDEVLEEKWRRIASDAATQTLKSGASFALGLVKTMVAVVKGDRVEAFVSCWDTLDSATQFLFSAVSIPMTIFGGFVGSKVIKGQKGRVFDAEQLEKADKQLKIDSVLQALSYYYGNEVNDQEASQAFKSADDATKTMKTGYKLYKSVKKVESLKDIFIAGGENAELPKTVNPIKEKIDAAKETVETIKIIPDVIDARRNGGFEGLAEYCVEETPGGGILKKSKKGGKYGASTIEDINVLYKDVHNNRTILPNLVNMDLKVSV